jgi:hypothetical protein
MVRTRADRDTIQTRANDTSARDTALASAAQWVSTDYPAPGMAQRFGSPYFVEIPGRRHPPRRPRSALRDRWLWLGALLAVAIALPNLIYQATNDWPQFQMAEGLAAADGAVNRTLFVPMQFLLLGAPHVIVQVTGLVPLWRDRRVRCFTVAYPVLCGLVLLAGGRPDYTIGMLVLLFAAGCEPTVRWLSTRARRRPYLGLGGLDGEHRTAGRQRLHQPTPRGHYQAGVRK